MKNNLNNLLIITAFAFLALFLISCTSVSEDSAKSSALRFIKTNVAFQSQNRTVTNPYMQVVNSRKESGNFVFDIIATTTSEEKIKSVNLGMRPI